MGKIGATKLGNYITLVSGRHIPAAEVTTSGGGHPYLTGPDDFVRGMPNPINFVKTGVFCEPGDVLIVVKGSGAGTILTANDRYVISRQLMALRTTKQNQRFVRQVVQAQTHTLASLASGTIPGLSRSDILGLQVPMPPLPEQRRIAAVLDAWDEAIATSERLIAAKRSKKRGIIVDIFGDAHNPFQVRGRPLGSFATVEYGVAIRPAEYVDAGTAWVVGTQGLVATTDRAEHSVGPAIITGRKGTLDKPFFIPDGQAFVAIDTTFVVRSLNLLRSLFHYLTYVDLKKLNEASGVPSVSADTLRTLPVPLATEEASTVLDALDDEIDLLTARTELLRTQKRGLMQRLLTGELPVPESVDRLMPDRMDTAA